MCKIINIICADKSLRKDVIRWIRNRKFLIEAIASYEDDPNVVKKYLKEMSTMEFAKMVAEIAPELARFSEAVTPRQEQMIKVKIKIIFLSFLFNYLSYETKEYISFYTSLLTLILI